MLNRRHEVCPGSVRFPHPSVQERLSCRKKLHRRTVSTISSAAVGSLPSEPEQGAPLPTKRALTAAPVEEPPKAAPTSAARRGIAVLLPSATSQKLLRNVIKVLRVHLWPILIIYGFKDVLSFFLHRASQRLTNLAAEMVLGLPMTTLANPWWLYLDSAFLEANMSYQALIGGFFVLSLPFNLLLNAAAATSVALIIRHSRRSKADVQATAKSTSSSANQTSNFNASGLGFGDSKSQTAAATARSSPLNKTWVDTDTMASMDTLSDLGIQTRGPPRKAPKASSRPSWMPSFGGSTASADPVDPAANGAASTTTTTGSSSPPAGPSASGSAAREGLTPEQAAIVAAAEAGDLVALAKVRASGGSLGGSMTSSMTSSVTSYPPTRITTSPPPLPPLSATAPLPPLVSPTGAPPGSLRALDEAVRGVGVVAEDEIVAGSNATPTVEQMAAAAQRIERSASLSSASSSGSSSESEGEESLSSRTIHGLSLFGSSLDVGGVAEIGAVQKQGEEPVGKQLKRKGWLYPVRRGFAEAGATLPHMRAMLRLTWWTELLMNIQALPLQAASLLVVPAYWTIPRFLGIQLALPVAILEGTGGPAAIARSLRLMSGARASFGWPLLALLLGGKMLDFMKNGALAALPVRYWQEVVEVPLGLLAFFAVAKLLVARMQDLLPLVTYLLLSRKNPAAVPGVLPTGVTSAPDSAEVAAARAVLAAAAATASRGAEASGLLSSRSTEVSISRSGSHEGLLEPAPVVSPAVAALAADAEAASFDDLATVAKGPDHSNLALASMYEEKPKSAGQPPLGEKLF